VPPSPSGAGMGFTTAQSMPTPPPAAARSALQPPLLPHAQSEGTLPDGLGALSPSPGGPAPAPHWSQDGSGASASSMAAITPQRPPGMPPAPGFPTPLGQQAGGPSATPTRPTAQTPPPMGTQQPGPQQQQPAPLSSWLSAAAPNDPSAAAAKQQQQQVQPQPVGKASAFLQQPGQAVSPAPPSRPSSTAPGFPGGPLSSPGPDPLLQGQLSTPLPSDLSPDGPMPSQQLQMGPPGMGMQHQQHQMQQQQQQMPPAAAMPAEPVQLNLPLMPPVYSLQAARPILDSCFT
jgi:hypothetical protein